MGREFAREESEFAEMEFDDDSNNNNNNNNNSFDDTELVRHVRDALLSATSGDNFSYELLRKVIHQNNCLSQDDVALLVTSLNGLSGAVSYINSTHHGTLLDSIFQMKLWDYGPDVMDAIADLIISLAAINGKHLDSCLAMLVGNFVPPTNFSKRLGTPRGNERKDQVIDHVHTALKKITELVPIAPMRLSNIICQQMPDIFKMEIWVAMYVENMLLLESSCIGELIGNLMIVAVVDRLVDFDVEIQIAPEDTSKGIFEMELEDVEGDMYDDYLEGDELYGVHSSSKKDFQPKFAEKLDSLLVLMFDHLRLCRDNRRLNKVFEILLRSFETTVLSTYKSKFTQFVVFYACSLDPEFCGTRFAHVLFNIFTDTGKPPIRRMGSIAYLASYLARAKFLLLSFVVEMLQRLVKWCSKYCENHMGDINTEAHRVFYSGCQAMMYVLCFRMRSMMDIQHLKLQLWRMKIETILNHPLDPLKVCLPSIVEEFLRQAKAAGLSRVPSGGFFNDLLDSELSRAFGGIERLDMFFPFDPCLLKKSDRFIRPNFIFWSMVRPFYDDDDDDEFEAYSEEEDEDLKDEDEYDIDEFDEDSLNKMSITPKSSSSYRFGGRQNGAKKMPSKIRPSTSPESL